MKKAKIFAITAIIVACLLAGFTVGRQYTITRSVLGYRTDGKFELNIDCHRYLKDNQTTTQLY